MQAGPMHQKYLVIGVDFFSDIGNKFIGLILLDLLVFKGASALSSLVLLCIIDQLPSVLLSPFAGVYIDRVGPKKWLMLVNMGKCVLVAVIAATASRWMIFPVYFCFILASLFFSIGHLSLVPMLIPKNRLMAFNALNERIAIAGGILSPWLIGMMLEKTGRTTALGLAGLIFAFTLLLIAGLPKLNESQPPAKAGQVLKPKTGRLFSRTRASFHGCHINYIYFLMLGFVLLGGGVLNIGLPFYFKTNLNGDIARWGFIMSAFQAGAFSSTLLLPICEARLKQQAIPSFSFLVLGGAMFVLPYATNYLQVSVLMFFLGCGFTLLHIFWESLIQQYSPRHMMGKTMSLLSSYKGLCYLGTVLAGAVISSFWGAESFLMIGSLVVGSAFFIPQKQ